MQIRPPVKVPPNLAISYAANGLRPIPEDIKNTKDLSDKNLSCMDFSRADLSGADLSGADLSGADLSGAYLSGAYLSGAYLSGAIYNDETDFPGIDLLFDKEGMIEVE